MNRLSADNFMYKCVRHGQTRIQGFDDLEKLSLQFNSQVWNPISVRLYFNDNFINAVKTIKYIFIFYKPSDFFKLKD